MLAVEEMDPPTTLLSHAVLRADPKEVRALLAMGFSASCRGIVEELYGQRHSVADAACFYGHIDILVALLQHGARRPSWFYAARGPGPRMEVFSTLLAFGADINWDPVTLNSPLIDLAMSGKAGPLAVVLQNGADINCGMPDDPNITALIIAACHGYKDCVGLLIRYGADLNVAQKYPLHSNTLVSET